MKRMNVIRILFSIVSAIVLYISVLENWSKINRENLCPLSLSLCPIYLELQALCIAYLSPRTKEISKSRVGQNRNETITFHVRDVLTRSNFRPKSVNVFMVRVPLESPVCLADAASLVLFERDPITSYKLYLPRVTQILMFWWYRSASSFELYLVSFLLFLFFFFAFLRNLQHYERRTRVVEITISKYLFQKCCCALKTILETISHSWSR